MKKILTLALPLFLFAAPLWAASYKIDPAHTQVLFKVRHLGISSVTGRFEAIEGSLTFDPQNIEASKTAVTLDVSSINTNQEKRDGHLKSCDFFCLEKFPKMTFTSKKVKVLGVGKFQVIGDLTLHGVTKEVLLDAQFNGEAKDPYGNERAGFSASASLNRKDYGLTWDKLTEAGGIMVGSEVTISIDIEAVKEKN